MIIPLAFDRIDGTNPKWTILFLHGILGRGNNLRTIAKRFIEARPHWTAFLVDLRGHGRSPKGSPDPSIAAAAGDVLALAAEAVPPVRAIVGHSLGGKIAMEAARLGGLRSLEHLIVLDSSPASRSSGYGRDSASAVIETLASLPETFPSRTDFLNALLDKGVTRANAQWLAQSIEPSGDRVRFALDLEEMRALMLDYMALDLWPVIENPPHGLRVHLVIGELSSSYDAADRERAAKVAAGNRRVTMDVLTAGHWVHVEDPDGVLRVLLEQIPD